MARQLFVNLAVEDLDRTVAFFTALGFTFNPKFTSDQATCLVISDRISVMLLTRPFFAGFTPKPIADAHAVTETLLALSCDVREEVDAIVAKAVAAGAATPIAAKDHGFMYQHGFEDLDGHLWEVFWMDEAAFPQPEG